MRTTGWVCSLCGVSWSPEVRRCEDCSPEPDRSGEALERDLAKAVFIPQFTATLNVPVTNHTAEPERAEADFGGYIGLARQRMRQAAEKVAEEDGA